MAEFCVEVTELKQTKETEGITQFVIISTSTNPTNKWLKCSEMDR